MKPIQVVFKPSAIFINLIVAVTLMACLTLILMPLMWQLKLTILSVILIASAYTILHYGLLRMPGSIVGLQVNIKNELYVERKNGRKVKAIVAANTTVTPYLVVVNFSETSTNFYRRFFNQALIVLPDSTDAEVFRQLRVWLRWANTEAKLK